MTRVTIAREDNRVEVVISGHADYSPGSPDIVCAACSILAQTLVQCVRELEAEGGVREMHIEQDKAAGFTRVVVTPTGWARERVDVMVAVIQSGFSLLEAGYPGVVGIMEKGG